MLATIYTKNIRDRWIGALIAAGGIVVISAFSIWIYDGLDDVFADLIRNYPEPVLAVLGLGDVGSTASLVLAQMFNVVAPLALGGLAIAIGAGTIAGEERDRTFGILMSHPRTRLHVFWSKLGAMATVLAGATVIVWAGSIASLVAVGADRSADVGAGSLHLFVLALMLGTLALALGAATGNAALAAGLTSGLMVLSFFGAGIFQAVDGWEWVARVFPWYWYNASTPLDNGVEVGHLGVLVAITVVAVGVSVIRIQRRDLMTGPGRTLVSAILEHPRLRPIADRITGRVSVSSMSAKAISDQRALTAIGAIAVLYVAVFVGPLYNLISEPLADMADAMPDALLAMIGSADFASPEGWLMGEVFSITAPAAVLAVTILVGVRGLAGEERRRTLGLITALPVARRSIVTAKAVSVVTTGAAVGFATFAGTAGGVFLGGLDVSYVGIAAISTHLAMLGVTFGLAALAIGAVTGKTRVAGMTTAAVAVVAYVINGFFPLRDDLADWVVVSPFHYFSGSDPLSNGFDWAHLAVLAIASAVAWAAAIWVFDRHDIAA